MLRVTLSIDEEESRIGDRKANAGITTLCARLSFVGTTPTSFGVCRKTIDRKSATRALVNPINFRVTISSKSNYESDLTQNQKISDEFG